MRYLILAVFLIVSSNLSSQNLGEPVFNYTSYEVVNDSVTLYEYIPVGSSSTYKEQYIEINNVCKAVKIIFYSYDIKRMEKILKEHGYYKVSHNMYYGPYNLVKVRINNDGVTSITFKLLE